MEDNKKPIISVRNLWKLYGDNSDKLFRNRTTPPSNKEIMKAGLFAAVRDVSFDVSQGETLVIMGLSGSGKSTLLRCVGRLIESSYGKTIVDGMNLEKASSAELINLRRHKMGMVFQHYALLAHRTVLENVELPLEVRGEAHEAREARAREMIDLVGLKGREDSFPSGLSGGQQQRVGIARSLAVDPDIWFLDEPFSALDPLIRRELQDEFLRLQKIVHKTILFVTHDFDEAMRLANRIAIMKNGRLVQVGTPEDLVLNPVDDYVASFTEHVNKSQIVTIGSIMTPVKFEVLPSGKTVLASSKLSEVADLIMENGEEMIVLDGNQKPVGIIAPDRVLKLLLESVNTG